MQADFPRLCRDLNELDKAVGGSCMLQTRRRKCVQHEHPKKQFVCVCVSEYTYIYIYVCVCVDTRTWCSHVFVGSYSQFASCFHLSVHVSACPLVLHTLVAEFISPQKLALSVL